MNENIDVYFYILIIVVIYLFFCSIHFICNKMEDRIYNSEEYNVQLQYRNTGYRNLNFTNTEYIDDELETLPIYSKKVLQNEKQIIPALPSYTESVLYSENIENPNCIFINS
jgi:hypothetical protein